MQYFTSLGNPINSNAYFEQCLLPVTPRRNSLLVNLYGKNVILLHCGFLSFSHGNEKNFTVTSNFLFFSHQSHHMRFYQFMALAASAPDQQILVAVSFWTHLSLCLLWNLSSLKSQWTVLDFLFVQFLLARIEVMTSKLFTCRPENSNPLPQISG